MNMLPMKHSFTYRKFLVLKQVFSLERQPFFQMLMKVLITQIKPFFFKCTQYTISMTYTLVFLPTPYEIILLCELQQFLTRIFFERNLWLQLLYISGKLNSETSYSRCSLQTVKMSTCKSQHNKRWNYCFAHIIWVTHSWLSALDLLCIVTRQSMHEQ